MVTPLPNRYSTAEVRKNLIALSRSSKELSNLMCPVVKRVATAYGPPNVLFFGRFENTELGGHLALVRSRGAALLTGDCDRRKAAELEGVSVDGTSWLVVRLVGLNIVSSTSACDAL